MTLSRCRDLISLTGVEGKKDTSMRIQRAGGRCEPVAADVMISHPGAAFVQSIARVDEVGFSRYREMCCKTQMSGHG